MQCWSAVMSAACQCVHECIAGLPLIMGCKHISKKTTATHATLAVLDELPYMSHKQERCALDAVIGTALATYVW